MIVVDSSALVAIGLKEPGRDRFFEVLAMAEAAVITPINYVETGVVMQRHGLIVSAQELHTWLERHGVALLETITLAESALAAYLRFGKGFHPARLNLADCFAYALAKELDAPLLYKGDDFAQTDVRSAIQPM